MSKLHQVISYFSYWLNEENEHSLHAPFVYDLYKKVIAKKPIVKEQYHAIERVRNQFIHSDKTIDIVDFGTGNKSSKSIKEIAKWGITKRKYTTLLDRLVDYTEAKNLIELGTSLGVNSLYLTTENDRHLTTFEGSPSLCAIAQAVFEGNQRTNIELIEGNIDETLPQFLQLPHYIDFVYFDANHSYSATMQYFDWLKNCSHDETCFVFDDIHKSPEMDRAWKEISSHFEVTLSIDLFQVGIVFINPEIRKQHYILTF